MPGNYITETIECGRLRIEETTYCFWSEVRGETNRLIRSYPIQYTILEEIYND